MDKDYEYRVNGNGQLWEMKNKLEEYQKKQNKWNQEREKLKKNLLLMEQEIKKQKNINSTLLKRASHKRTCSDEPTFIFNQTNISSYYPVVLMNQKQKQQKTNNKNMDSNTKVGKDESPISLPNQPLINQNINSKSKGLSNIAQYADLNLSSQSNTNTHVTCSNNRNLNLSNTAPTNNSWVPRANLRSHLDSVRTLRWQGQFLISAGQDCLLKIWDKDKLRITVRQHLAPVFTLCGDEKTVFSGGAEGVVRKWVVDEFMESARPVAQAQLHDDSIWDMIWLSNHALLITSSSDSSIKLIRSQTSNSLVLSSQINVNPQITTSICALPNQQLACGVVKNPKMLLFNIEKPHKPAQFVPFEHQTSPNFQPNKLLLYSPKNLLVSGHQDHVIRLFDLNSNKSIGNIVAHSDAVTSLCIRESTKKQHEIISSGHDGTVRVWDVRKWKCVHDIGVHMKKYDESLLALAFSAELDLLAVGGADGQIKLLSPQI